MTVKGKSQAGSASPPPERRQRRDRAPSRPASDGLWETEIAVANGTNAIAITAVDPAGNENTTELRAASRGPGELTAALTGSAYRFRASKLPKRMTLTVAVTDSDGRRLQGATALFTVSVPGLEAIVSGEIKTNGDGIATFRRRSPPARRRAAASRRCWSRPGARTTPPTARC